MYFTLQYIRLRVCLKKAFCKMCVTICRIFCPDEGAVAGYGNCIRVKYPALRKAFFKRAQKKSYISEILNVFLFQKYI